MDTETQRHGKQWKTERVWGWMSFPLGLGIFFLARAIEGFGALFVWILFVFFALGMPFLIHWLNRNLPRFFPNRLVYSEIMSLPVLIALFTVSGWVLIFNPFHLG